MPLLSWGEYRPDVADYLATTSRNILNVLPRGDGYGPFPSVSPFSGALPAACRGAFYALKSDGSVAIFAGTSDRLYVMDNTTFGWADVSKDGEAYLALTATSYWQFAQFGSLVIAVQANVPPQVFDLSSSNEFGDLDGSPPQAAYIAIVGRFIVLSGLLSNPYRIQWSGLNDVTTWSPGVNSSDIQDFPDGGIVRGVGGGENGIVFQDQAIRRMSFIPGSPLVFQIDRISQDKGLYAPYSIIRAGETIFFLSSHGFQKVVPGGLPEQIGRERVDRTFFEKLDKGSLRFIIGSADPRSTRVYWSYKTTSGQDGIFDRVVGYDYALDRFFPVDVTGEYLLGISQTGVTLESLDHISASIDAMELTLDAYATAVQPELGIFNPDHVLGFFRGPPLEAKLETAEQGTDGQRLFVRGFRPVVDAGICYGAASYRDLTSAQPDETPEIAKSSRTGRCDIRKSTRYSRFRIRVPAGEDWTFSAGVEPDVTTEGYL